MITEKFANNSGVQVQYFIVEKTKNEIQVVFIPGAMVSAEDFLEDIKDKIDMNCIVVSCRGLGKSDAPENGYSKEHLISDIKAVLESEKLSSVYLIGHSFGAGIASAFAAEYPEKIKGLVLAEYPPAYPAYPQQWAERVLEQRPDANKNLVNGLVNESKKEMFTEKLSKCNFNILILKGANEDSMLRSEFINKIIGELPNSKLQVINNAGHELFIDSTEETLKAINDFMQP